MSYLTYLELAKYNSKSVAEQVQKAVGGVIKDIGSFRLSEPNSSHSIDTQSPEYGQKAVIVVSVFEDASMTYAIFANANLSEIGRYDEVGMKRVGI